MQEDAGINLGEVMLNGGITSNKFVLRFIAGLLECPVFNQAITDISALGAAYLAGLEAGIFRNLEQLGALSANRRQVDSDFNREQLKVYYNEWKTLIEKC